MKQQQNVAFPMNISVFALLLTGIVYAREYEKFHTETLCDIHRTIFGGLYEWPVRSERSPL